MEWLRKNKIFLIFGSISAILLGIISFSFIYTTVSWDPTETSTMIYTEIVSELEEDGFQQISLEPVKDLKDGGGISKQTGIDITFDGELYKKSNQWFKRNAKVVIRYHDYPDDLIELKGENLSKNSTQLVEQLQKIGFTNVVRVMEGEDEILSNQDLNELLINGEKITVGAEMFENDNSTYAFPKDAEVKVVYFEPLLTIPEIIRYDSYEDYNEYVEKLKDEGFTNIQVVSEASEIGFDKHLSYVSLDGKEYMELKKNRTNSTFPVKVRKSIPIIVTYKDSSEAIAKRNEEIAKQNEKIAKQRAYEEKIKNPASYQTVSYDAWIHEEIPVGTLARVTGEVIEVGEGGLISDAYIRISMDGMFNQDVYVSIDNDYFKSNILAEGDSVTLYGSVQGRKTYTTVLGASRTIPQMSVNFYNRN